MESIFALRISSDYSLKLHPADLCNGDELYLISDKTEFFILFRLTDFYKDSRVDGVLLRGS
jgi:hypothetical protein